MLKSAVCNGCGKIWLVWMWLPIFAAVMVHARKIGGMDSCLIVFLLDAPCSATGIIRRHPDIKVLRTPEEIARLSDLQGQLLDSLWPLLKPDGIILYATCSVMPRENTQVVEAFIKRQAGALHEPISADWGIPQTCGRQLLPQIDGHDGFYYARLRKAVINNDVGGNSPKINPD